MKKDELNIEIGVNLAISEETAKTCLAVVQMYCNTTNYHINEQVAIDTNEVILFLEKRR